METETDNSTEKYNAVILIDDYRKIMLQRAYAPGIAAQFDATIAGIEQTINQLDTHLG